MEFVSGERSTGAEVEATPLCRAMLADGAGGDDNARVRDEVGRSNSVAAQRRARRDRRTCRRGSGQDAIGGERRARLAVGLRC